MSSANACARLGMRNTFHGGGHCLALPLPQVLHSHHVGVQTVDDPDDSESAPAWRAEHSDESGTCAQCSPRGLPAALRPPGLVADEGASPARGLLGAASDPTKGTRGASFPPRWDASSDATVACEGGAACARQSDDFEGLLAAPSAEADLDASASSPAWQAEQSEESETHFLHSPCGHPVGLRHPGLVTDEGLRPARGLLGGGERPF